MNDQPDETGCFTPAFIQRMLGGELNDASVEVAEEHLNHCQSCRQAVETSLKEGELHVYPNGSNSWNFSQGTTVGQEENVSDESRSPIPAPVAGQSIGPFRLIRPIGQGGMGTVWLARQVEPVQRNLAIKLIHPGLLDETMVDRFRIERQTLAQMDHPHIAKVIEAGTTESGQLYLAMEWIRGKELTEFCDEKRLSIRQRLELLIPICQAIGHAHQKGIIHRDIKPSNVLVSDRDGQPFPVVIDFGLAKSFDPASQTQTSPTRFGSILGTLAYMSPEQSTLDPNDIDTRADLYSLGVLLFELLTGSTPLEKSSSQGASVADLLDRIRNQDSPLPSQRIRDDHEDRAKHCGNRATNVAQLRRLLENDLDWIVGKALENERDRRYPTTDALVGDIRRFLNDEPVIARPPGTVYRLQKFYRRQKKAVWAAIAILMFLVLGIIGTSYGLFRALRSEKESRDLAIEQSRLRGEATKLAENEKLARTDAELRLVHARNSYQILASILQDLNPQASFSKPTQPLRVQLSEKLIRAVRQLEKDKIGGPVEMAEMKALLAQAIYGMARFDEAVKILESVVTVFTNEVGPFDHRAREAKLFLIQAYIDNEQVEQAVRLAGEFSRDLKRYDEGDLKNDFEIQLTKIQIMLVAANQKLGKQEEVTRLLTALTPQLAELPSSNPMTGQLANQLGISLFQRGQFDQARLQFLQAEQICRESLGPEDPATLNILDNLAMTYQNLSQVDRSIEIYERILEVRRQRDGESHVDSIRMANNLAVALNKAGKIQRAETLLTEMRELASARYGPNSQIALVCWSNLAANKRTAKKYAEAISLYEEMLPRFMKGLGEAHPETLNVRLGLGTARLSSGKVDSAIIMLEQWWSKAESKMMPGNLRRREGMLTLAKAYRQKKDNQKVVDLLTHSARFAGEHFGRTDKRTIAITQYLAAAHYELKNFAEVEPLFSNMYDYFRNELGPENLQTIFALYNLSVAKLQVKKIDEAIKLFDEYERRYAESNQISALEDVQSRLDVARQFKAANLFVEAERRMKLLFNQHQIQLAKEWPLWNARGKILMGTIVWDSVLAAEELENESRFGEVVDRLQEGIQILEQLKDDQPGLEKEVNAAKRLLGDALSRLECKLGIQL